MSFPSPPKQNPCLKLIWNAFLCSLDKYVCPKRMQTGRWQKRAKANRYKLKSKSSIFKFLQWMFYKTHPFWWWEQSEKSFSSSGLQFTFFSKWNCFSISHLFTNLFTINTLILYVYPTSAHDNTVAFNKKQGPPLRVQLALIWLREESLWEFSPLIMLKDAARAQLVKKPALDFGSGHAIRVRRSSPVLGSTWSPLEILCLPLFLPYHLHPLSLS